MCVCRGGGGGDTVLTVAQLMYVCVWGGDIVVTVAQLMCVCVPGGGGGVTLQ